jgi:hypothetical protein
VSNLSPWLAGQLRYERSARRRRRADAIAGIATRALIGGGLATALVFALEYFGVA